MRLDRIWHFVESTDLDMADASERILEHRHRREQLEAAAEEARAVLAERRELLDSADTAEIALNGGVRSIGNGGGAGGNRTPLPLQCH